MNCVSLVLCPTSIKIENKTKAIFWLWSHIKVLQTGNSGMKSSAWKPVLDSDVCTVCPHSHRAAEAVGCGLDSWSPRVKDLKKLGASF